MVFALSFLIISYLQVLSSKLIKSNHCCFSIYSFHAFIYVYSKLNKITDLLGSRWFICTTTMKKICLLIALLMSIQLASAQRKTVIVETPTNQVQDDGMVLKRKVAIERFSNEPQYAKGIFYDKENDPMENKLWTFFQQS